MFFSHFNSFYLKVVNTHTHDAQQRIGTFHFVMNDIDGPALERAGTGENVSFVKVLNVIMLVGLGYALRPARGCESSGPPGPTLGYTPGGTVPLMSLSRSSQATTAKSYFFG